MTAWKLLNIGYLNTPFNGVTMYSIVVALLSGAVLASFWCHGAWASDKRTSRYKAKTDPHHLWISGAWALVAAIGVRELARRAIEQGMMDGIKPNIERWRIERIILSIVVAIIAFGGAMLLRKLASRKRYEVPLKLSAALFSVCLVAATWNVVGSIFRPNIRVGMTINEAYAQMGDRAADEKVVVSTGADGFRMMHRWGNTVVLFRDGRVEEVAFNSSLRFGKTETSGLFDK